MRQTASLFFSTFNTECIQVHRLILNELYSVNTSGYHYCTINERVLPTLSKEGFSWSFFQELAGQNDIIWLTDNLDEKDHFIFNFQ